MKKSIESGKHDGLRPEYNFASMRGGVCGKHYEQYRQSSNVALLKPDVAQALPTEDAVNEALRGILSTTRAIRRTGGLSDRALKQNGASKRGRRRS